MFQRRAEVKYQSVKLHPFGSCISSRGFSSAAYRYGFNGKEKEADGTADNYDFGARIYDGRLGRWLAGDPEFKKFKSFSTFCFALNIPVYFVDPDGGVIDKPEGAISKITPALNLCTKSTTFCNYLNQFYDISKGGNPGRATESGSLSNVTLKIEAFDADNGSVAGECLLFYAVKATDGSESLIEVSKYEGDYQNITGIAQKVRIGYNVASEHREVLLDQQAYETETILHECLIHGETQVRLINEATTDGKVDYAKLQEAYKKQYPTDVTQGEDHDKLGKGQCGTFNKAVEEVKSAILAMSVENYYWGTVTLKSENTTGNPDDITFQKDRVLNATEYSMSQWFTNYVETDIIEHKIDPNAPKLSGETKPTGEITVPTSVDCQVKKGSAGKQYSQPSPVQLPKNN